jgi:hypothetical protein
MKIQVVQTLPNGQVTQQVLSKEGPEVLKIQAQPGAQMSFNVEGAKPAEALNTEAKTGNIKKSGNNLVLESEGEQLVEVTDFYSTAGASVGNVGWNYAATDAVVMTATPEAQALASNAAVSESGVLFPAIAPGWLVAGGAATVAAVASGGGNAVASVGTTVVSGTVMLGPVKSGNGLFVTLYKADGSELASAVAVGANGKFSFSYSAAYTGVVMARVADTTLGADYRDEATNTDKDLSSDIRALFSTTGEGTINITLSALSEIAVRQILGNISKGDNGQSSVTAGAITAAQITAKNAELAVSLGLTGNVVTDFTISPTIDADGKPANPNTAGLIVAALSGLDAIHGTDGALDLLAATGTGAGTGATSTSMIELVAEGAQQAGVLVALSTDVAAVHDVASAAVISAAAVSAGSLTSVTLSALSPLVLAQFSTAQIAAIPDAAMAGLTVAQLAAFMPAQVGAITATQVDNLTPAQITALGNDVGSLSAAAVASLDAAQVQALSAAQLNALAVVSAPTSTVTLTNVTAPTLTGTFTGKLPAGAQIHVYDGATDLGVASVLGDTWSFASPAVLITQGAHSLTAQIQVAGGSSAKASAAFVLTLDSVAPIVTTAYTTNENAGTDTTAHTITLVGTDTNGPVTFSGLSGTDAAKFSLNSSTGVLSFVGQTNYEVADDAGANHVYDVNVVATDAAGNAVTQAVTVTVNNVNEAPTTVGTIAAKTAVVSQAFTLATAAYFADVDAGGLTGGVYSATGLGNGLSINASTGVISGTALANAAVAPVVVTFTDAGGLAVSQTAFNLQAVSAPVVQSFTVVDATGATTKGTSGEALTFAVTFSEAITVTGTLTAVFSVNGQSVTATYTGAGGTALSFTGGVVPSTGDGTGISLTSLSGTTSGNVSGQPVVAPTAASLTYTGYTVDNTAPTVTAAYFSNENAGTDTTAHTITLVGTDTNGPVTFSGLSGTDAAKFSLNSSTGVLSFVGQTNYEVADDAGANHVYDVNVVATDAAGNAVTQAVTVTVNNVNEAPVVAVPLIDQVAVLSKAFTYVVPTGAFTDVDAGTAVTYSATLVSGADLSTATGWTGLAFNATTHTFTGTATDATTGDIDVRVTASDGTLSVYDDFHINAVSAPALSTTLGGVLNFDVRSNIVLTVGETVTKNSLGHIIITDLGGTGFSGESTTHTIDLNMAVAADAARVSIVGTGADTKIVVNPEFDLDLSSNYSLSIDPGVFHGVTSGQDSLAFSTVNFSTVTPGTSTTTAAAGTTNSQAQGYFTDAFADAAYLPTSVISNTPTYGLYNTAKWVDMAGVGSVGAATALQVDASTGDYVFVWKDMKSQSTGNGEIALADTQIQLNKFGANDLVYIDNQENQTTAQADIVANGVTGGVGSAADPSWFAFEGVLLGANIYIAVDPIHALPTYTDGQLANLTSNGWSNTGMVISA